MAKPKLSEFESYNDAATYFEGTDQFKNLTPVDRVQALDHLKTKYSQTMIGKKVPKEVVKADEESPEGGLAHRIRDKLMSASEGIGGNPALNGIGKTLHFISSQLPDSNAQALIDAVMTAGMFTGEGEVAEGASLVNKGISMLPQAIKPVGRFAARVAEPTIAGAIGGETEGKPFSGAALGAGEGVGGEIMSGLARRGRSTINNLDMSSLSGWLEKHLGNAAEMRTPEAFDQKIRGGQMLEDVKAEGSAVESKIKKLFQKQAKKIPGKMGYLGQQTSKITMPELEIDVPPALADKLQVPRGQKLRATFADMTGHLQQIEDIGWDLAGSPKTGRQGEIARSMAIQMEDDIAEQIQNKLGNGPATDWLTSRYRTRLAKTTTKMLKEAGVDKGTGLINWPKLQDLAANKYRMDLQLALGPDASAITGAKDAEELLNNLYRGDQHTMTDAPGAFKPYIRAHAFGLIPSLGVHPKMARHVGDLPYNLGRGRALTAAMIMGPYRAVQFAKDLAGMNEEADQQPMAEPNAEATPNAAMR